MFIIMSSIRDFSLPEAYESIRSMDSLPQIDRIIDWDSLRPLVRSLFHNDSEKGGRPNFDEVVMIKALFLQGLYNIVDEKLEKELLDRISFRNFLHYPEKMPDARTIWALRERMAINGTDRKIWSEIWRQLESKGIVIRKGVIQDASFITSDHGKHGRKKPPAPDMPEPSEKHVPEDSREAKRQARASRVEKKRLKRDDRRASRTRRSKDGTFARKDGKNFFGYKQHSSHGVDLPLVREFIITTASVHDSQVDLSVPGMPCYRDRGYQGAPCRGINGTMDRASRNTPLTIDQVRRNLRISRKRTPGERPYSVIKRVQNGGHTLVTMVRRVRVKMTFVNMAYNLSTVVHMKRRGVIA